MSVLSSSPLRAAIRLSWLLPAGLALPLAAQSPDRVPATPNCESCAAWNAPHAPVRLHGNSYYVGTDGLTALLVTSPDGHVLIDGGLPESAPLIRRSIEALGFRMTDIKVIVNSHTHIDHAGGIALLARWSGATVAASPASARWLEAGNGLEDDPQFGLFVAFPQVPHVRRLTNGERVTVGPLTLTAHFTGGHTPGGTSWSWRSCDETTCLSFVYADSQTPISADGFRFTDSRTYATGVRDFQAGQATLERLPCDVLVTPHPAASALWARVAAGTLVNPDACRDLVAGARRALAERLARERAGR
jgi:metallo-beta-lactamase class B